MLAEVPFKRKGCSSYLRLLCTHCGWKHCFYTSKKVNKYFEVNRRLVYGMRTIGEGASKALQKDVVE
jgi:RNase P subunit RPR2